MNYMDKASTYVSEKLDKFRLSDFSFAFLQSNFLLYSVIALLVVRVFVAIIFVPLPQNIFFADITKIDLLNLLNQSRSNVGTGELTESAILDKAANLKAQDMIANNYFSHESPQGINPWFWFKKVNYTYAYAGENLAIGFFDSEDVYTAWLNSPSHKKNLLNPNYKEVGTAVVQGFGDNNSTVVVQLFGSLAPKTPAPIKNVKKEAPSTSLKVVKDTAVPVPSPVTVIVEPTQTASQTEITVPRVLSESTSTIVQADPDITAKPSAIAYIWLLNFIVYNQNTIFSNTIYLLLVVIASMMVGSMIKSELPRNIMVLRSFMIISLLLVSLFIKSDNFSVIVSHQINI